MADETNLDHLRGVRMSDAEIDEFLTKHGTGVLALDDGGDAYAVPISFGYDEGRRYFAYFRFVDEPRKEAYTETTATACLVVYEAESAYRWRSILARGPIEPVAPDRWDEVGAAMDDAWSPDLSTIGPRRATVGTYMIAVEATTGRKGKAYA